MFDFVSAMNIFAKYEDYPSFDFDNEDKMIHTNISIDRIPQERADGMRLVQLGWEVGALDNWVMSL